MFPVFVVAMLQALACNRSKPVPNPTQDPASKPAQAASRPVAEERVLGPAVAGSFYPGDPETLRKQVDAMLAQAKARDLRGLRALISPHAGYPYSGPIAASGYKQLAGLNFERVVILAVSHRVPLNGVAIPDADALATPLGKVRVGAAAKALGLKPPFVIDSSPHAKEHSLEVQLPFLQVVLGQFEIVPLVFGDTDEAQVAQGVLPLADARTLFIASSDLSHYHPYEQAKRLDDGTVAAILKLDLAAIGQREACGKGPILALVHLARARGWKAILLDSRSSGDTAGDRSRVVGYASIVFVES